MRLKRRLERLERNAPPPPPPIDRQRLARRRKVLSRWSRLVDAARPLLPESDQPRLQQGLAQLREYRGGPLAAWVRDLCDGRCRLPPLETPVMRDLLLAWLSPEANGGMVCRECGLEWIRHRTPPLSEWKLLPGKRPIEGPPPWYDLPVFFETCPHCGGSRFEADWPHQVAAYDRPWKRLDGYVGAAVAAS